LVIDFADASLWLLCEKMDRLAVGRRRLLSRNKGSGGSGGATAYFVFFFNSVERAERIHCHEILAFGHFGLIVFDDAHKRSQIGVHCSVLLFF
jgi:hypothetical protein